MPLFVEPARSEEVSALVKAQEILSHSTALAELFGVTLSTELRALIYLCAGEPPADAESFTLDEQKSRLGWAQLHPPLEEDSYVVRRSLAVGATPEKKGRFRLHVRRQVKEAEYNDLNGRRDAYLFFLDRTSRMCEEFIEAADLNLAGGEIMRHGVPLINHRDDWADQGIFLWCDFVITWGGSEYAE